MQLSKGDLLLAADTGGEGTEFCLTLAIFSNSVRVLPDHMNQKMFLL